MQTLAQLRVSVHSSTPQRPSAEVVLPSMQSIGMVQRLQAGSQACLQVTQRGAHRAQGQAKVAQAKVVLAEHADQVALLCKVCTRQCGLPVLSSSRQVSVQYGRCSTAERQGRRAWAPPRFCDKARQRSSSLT